MANVVAYKMALLTLLAVTGATSGGAIYFQQRTTNLNNQVSDLDRRASESEGQMSSLITQTNALTNQVNQLNRGHILTFLQGTTNSSAAVGSIPVGIVFDTSYWNPDVPVLSSVIQSTPLQGGGTVYHYQLYIVPGKTYTVSILYRASNGYGFCSARPNPFVPMGIDLEQDFACG